MLRSRTALGIFGAALLGTGLMAGSASAASIDFDILGNQFSKPTMAFEFKNGKYVWDKKPITTSFTAKGSAGSGFLWEPTVMLIPNGKGGKALSGKMPTNRNFSHSGQITFPANFLAAYQGNYASLCAKNGGSEKRVFDHLTATFTVVRSYHEKNTPPEVGGPPGPRATKAVTMPMTVVCGAMPKRVPGVDLKVEQVKLYTIPAAPACGKPVKLVAEFHTNKAGKVNFTLHRHDGEKQNASINVGEAGSGFAKRWAKEYRYKQSIERSYKISVKGQDIPAQWVSVKVNCGAKDSAMPVGDLTD